MKYMTMTLSIIALLAACSLSFAEQRPHISVDQYLERLTTVCDLTPRQQVLARTVLADELAEMKELRQMRDDGASRFSIMRKAKSIQESTKESLSSFLSETQMEAYEKMIEERRDKMRTMMKHRKNNS